jgi:hypothetical protein
LFLFGCGCCGVICYIIYKYCIYIILYYFLEVV